MQLNTLKNQGCLINVYLDTKKQKNTYPHIEVFTDYNHAYFHEAFGKTVAFFNWFFLVRVISTCQ